MNPEGTAATVAGRSWLFTPGTRPDRFDRAASSGADRLIIDLEDAVAADQKDAARNAVFEYLLRPAESRTRVALRINALDTRAGLDDLQMLVRSSALPGSVLLPKAESADLVAIVGRLLADAPTVRLAALIETAAGLAQAEAIAGASARLELLMFGAADMASDLGADGSWESLLYARSRVVAAARAAGILAIDAPWFVIEDIAGLERETERARALGFDGKAAIHPRHVGPINGVMRPSTELVEQARQILAVAATGVGMLDGKMVDEAMARRARRILALAGLPTAS
jgi:(S)-citramalyl-CoA lyase